MPPAYLKGPEVPRMGQHLPGCTGKRPHPDQRAARAHAAGVGAAHLYLCRFCGHWHVSSRGIGNASKIKPGRAT